MAIQITGGAFVEQQEIQSKVRVVIEQAYTRRSLSPPTRAELDKHIEEIERKCLIKTTTPAAGATPPAIDGSPCSFNYPIPCGTFQIRFRATYQIQQVTSSNVKEVLSRVSGITENELRAKLPHHNSYVLLVMLRQVVEI